MCVCDSRDKIYYNIDTKKILNTLFNHQLSANPYIFRAEIYYKDPKYQAKNCIYILYILFSFISFLYFFRSSLIQQQHKQKKIFLKKWLLHCCCFWSCQLSLATELAVSVRRKLGLAYKTVAFTLKSSTTQSRAGCSAVCSVPPLLRICHPLSAHDYVYSILYINIYICVIFFRLF